MLLSSVIRFQKTLALAAAASNEYEAVAAELAARRIMDTCYIDPTGVPNASLYSRVSFADNALLKKLRAEWREAHPLPEKIPVEEEVEVTDFGSLSIPFNMEGFRRHDNHSHNRRGKRKRTRQQAAVLTPQDYEDIRQLLNDNCPLREIAELTGFHRDTINSTRAWHIRSNKWFKDENGHFQWADRRHAPAPTKPQPSEENAEENEATLVP